MMTKVMKYIITDFIDNEWKLMYKIFDELRYEAWRISNRAINMYWDIESSNYAFKQKHGQFFKINEIKGITQSSLRGYISSELKKEFTKINAHSVDSINTKVEKEWKSHKNKIFKGNESMITYKRENAQILARATQFKIEHMSNNEYKIGVRLLNRLYAKHLHENGIETKEKVYKKNDDSMWMYFKVKTYDNNQKSIIDRIISGEYKLGTSAFLYNKRKKKWFINLAYSFEPIKKQLDPNRIMGIDMGVNIPAMLAISDSPYYRQAVGSKEEVESFRRQIEARRRGIQRQRKWCGEGSIGHGVKTRLKPLEKLSGKIARFKDTKNHCWSRYIINEAIKNNCGTIQMENLTGIAKDNAFLKNWTYDDLRQKITYKAEEVGIKVVIIDPYKTSSRCHKCGHIHSSKNKDDWRPKQEKFICESCGFKTNADWNAAKNIATKGIEKIIKKQMEKQDQEYKHGLKYVVN